MERFWAHAQLFVARLWVYQLTAAARRHRQEKQSFAKIFSTPATNWLRQPDGRSFEVVRIANELPFLAWAMCESCSCTSFAPYLIFSSRLHSTEDRNLHLLWIWFMHSSHVLPTWSCEHFYGFPNWLNLEENEWLTVICFRWPAEKRQRWKGFWFEVFEAKKRLRGDPIKFLFNISHCNSACGLRHVHICICICICICFDSVKRKSIIHSLMRQWLCFPWIVTEEIWVSNCCPKRRHFTKLNSLVAAQTKPKLVWSSRFYFIYYQNI